MASIFKDNPDLQFYFERGIDWQALVAAVERGQLGADSGPEDGFANLAEAVEFYRDIVEMVSDFVAAEIAPHVARLDREEPRLEDGEVVFPEAFERIFAKLRELDVYGMCVPRELGGLNVPLLVYFLVLEQIARADGALMSHFGFHGGIAMTLLAMSIVEGTTEADAATGRITRTRFADAIAEIIEGRASGAMDITEPDAGSDMSALRARGEQDEHGKWHVTGQKIFITSGHGKYHVVIARTEGPDSGLDGLSLFLVPTYREDENGARERLATLDRVEDKLGHHSSATVAITFERTPAWLIGKRGEGFRMMLYLMNGARVGVGFESIGLCEAALRLARSYTAQRPSMGKSIDRHEMIADYLDEMETDILGLRALAVHCAFHEELGQHLDFAARMDVADDQLSARRQSKHHRGQARRGTSLLK